MEKDKNTVFYCTTYRHVLVTISKVLSQKIVADIIIGYEHSAIDKSLACRLRKAEIFGQVYEWEEPVHSLPPRKKILDYIWSRYFEVVHVMQKRFPVAVEQYKKIYTFYDADLLGTYLNIRKIPYHLMEDAEGIFSEDTMNNHPVLKAIENRYMCEKNPLERFFFESGFTPGIYGIAPNCIDITVASKNGLRENRYTKNKFKEEPLQKNFDKLTLEQKQKLISVFLPNVELTDSQNQILLLTSPLITDGFVKNMDEQATVYKAVIKQLQESEPDSSLVIKPHPRDTFNYMEIIGDNKNVLVLSRNFPSELFNLLKLDFKRYVTIASCGARAFPQEKVMELGMDYIQNIIAKG